MSHTNKHTHTMWIIERRGKEGVKGKEMREKKKKEQERKEMQRKEQKGKIEEDRKIKRKVRKKENKVTQY